MLPLIFCSPLIIPPKFPYNCANWHLDDQWFRSLSILPFPFPVSPLWPWIRLGTEERVVSVGIAWIYTEPPLPPFPPEGGPNGLNFSRWKAAQPSPPRPPRTVTTRWSRNVLPPCFRFHSACRLRLYASSSSWERCKYLRAEQQKVRRVNMEVSRKGSRKSATRLLEFIIWSLQPINR